MARKINPDPWDQRLGDNVMIAEKLREHADLLDGQGEEGVSAYRRASDIVARL
ncbi:MULTISPECIES: helix-hairpin-helix domain-containing protein [Ensifer]|uniref:helix-hairpin-helix domain-containing protein n=1 Tax=Ensifer TaxID=106591 RepID=UPI0015EC243D|nr:MULTISPECIES: helix-hairpin-helix domain-containing protein [Ensifer]MCY1746302.1 helix-hairpin-helix domain-containing protein [Ensifer sp. SL37]